MIGWMVTAGLAGSFASISVLAGDALGIGAPVNRTVFVKTSLSGVDCATGAGNGADLGMGIGTLFSDKPDVDNGGAAEVAATTVDATGKVRAVWGWTAPGCVAPGRGGAVAGLGVSAT